MNVLELAEWIDATIEDLISMFNDASVPAPSRTPRHYALHLSGGVLTLQVPEELTDGDVEDLETLLALIVKQAKRRSRNAYSEDVPR